MISKSRLWMTVVLILIVLAPQSLAATEGEAAGKSLAIFNLKGAITETPKGDDLLFGSAGGESLKDLVARLHKARDDDSVVGIVLMADGVSIGSAQIEEIRRAMAGIIAAGKEIHVHADSLSMGSYVLLSGASDVSVVPTGDIWINGIYGESLYLRGLLEKIGVTPDFFTCGEYKSAGEMFMLKQPSDKARENLEWLFDGIFDTYVQLIVDGRNVSSNEARQWIDRGLYSAESAREAGIIDNVQYRQDFVAQLKSKYGDDVRFDRRYGKKTNSINLSTPMGLFKFYADLLTGSKLHTSTRDAIAVVYVEGPIVPGSSQPFPLPLPTAGVAYSTPIRKALDAAAADDSIKAVVLRVNSPGGSAVASEIILNATKRVKARKPIVVSMGDVAGSGGYYVACGADTIFVDSSTITGSIGVVVGKLATNDMWNKVGINWAPIQRGANAGMLSSGNVFTDEERAQLMAWMTEVYEVFKQHVLEIRGDRLTKDIEQLAGGRVYTGQQALELGLVDKIGGLDDALEFSAKQAGLSDYDVRVLPRPKNFMELLLSDLTGDGDDEGPALSLETGTQLQAPSLMQLAYPHLRGLEPGRIDSVMTALQQLELLQRERVLLSMPIITIH